jgi:hypothetical protein
MKEDNNPDCWFTTMFDLYALPNDFPGFDDSLKTGDKYEWVRMLEKQFGKDINHHRFIPYIQLHEFETLVLASPQMLDWEYLEHEKYFEKNVLILMSGSPSLKICQPNNNRFHVYKQSSLGTIFLFFP